MNMLADGNNEIFLNLKSCKTKVIIILTHNMFQCRIRSKQISFCKTKNLCHMTEITSSELNCSKKLQFTILVTNIFITNSIDQMAGRLT